MKLSELNALSEPAARELLYQCCASDAWVSRMLEIRPFASKEIALDMACLSWLDLSEQDYLQAFDGHPRIGDIQSLKEKYKHTQTVGQGSQRALPPKILTLDRALNVTEWRTVVLYECSTVSL